MISKRTKNNITLVLSIGVFLPLLIPPFLVAKDLKAQAAPAIYNIEALNSIRDNKKDGRLTVLLEEADNIVSLQPLSVFDKKKSFGPNKHYYSSISHYAWPDADKPNGPYVIKDGQNNPEYAEYDGDALDKLAYRLEHLCTAYYITGNSAYKRAVEKQLKVWFLNKKTRMLPNFEYAQVLPGHNDNKGQTYGLAELSRFTVILESIMLFDYSKGLNEREKRKLKAWFNDFQEWLLKSRQWHIITKVNDNNITSSSYLALVEMSLFIGNKRVADKLANDYKERIIDAQIDDEGKQPAELRRTVGFGYSVGNLEEIIRFCLVMENLGVPLYKENQNKIDKAIEYLYQFVDNHDAFPYQQTASWGWYEDRLRKIIMCLSRLTADDTKTKKMADSLEWDGNTILDVVYF